jgi:hypothetical protein
MERKKKGVVSGPRGPMSLADLPDPNTRRWVPSRKAMVIAAVNGGLISMEEACKKYNLSVEEFLEWKTAEEYGDLRISRIPEFRRQRAA